MTEEQAKTKWCPAFRGNDHGINRPLEMEGLIGRCLGSSCMAWRGKESAQFARRAEDEFHRSGRRLAPSSADIDGYCGLAGAPR